MDDLAFHLELPRQGVNLSDGERKLRLFFYAIINTLDLSRAIGNEKFITNLPINYTALKASVKRSSFYPMFVCICGLTFCDSIHINVLVTPDAIVWKDYYSLDEFCQPTRIISEFSYEFGIKDYEKAIQSLEEAIGVYAARFGRDKVLGPGETKYIDLIEQYAT